MIYTEEKSSLSIGAIPEYPGMDFIDIIPFIKKFHSSRLQKIIRDYPMSIIYKITNPESRLLICYFDIYY